MSKIAFILAAGTGTRMLPLTKNSPKPLLKINNKPMIRYVLDLLEFHKFNKIGINLSYRGEEIQNYLKNESISFFYEKNPSGTAGGVLAISKKIKPQKPFLVVSSDMMVNFDLTKIYQFHLKHKSVATICCYFRPKSKLNAKKSGQVLFDRKTKKITRVLERSEQIISQWINSSVYIFDPSVLSLLEEFRQKVIDIPTDLIPNLLSSGKKVLAYPINSKRFYQLGVDTPLRISQVENDIQSGKFIPTIP